MLGEIRHSAADYHVVLEPDENEPEWWAGAPSVVRDADGRFHLAARMREGRSPKGQRGYEIRILSSPDGREFQTISHIAREDAGVPGFERPALVIDPETGKFRLYCCTIVENGWGIIRFDDAETPEGFRAETVRTVLRVETPDDGTFRVGGYKDPVIFHDGGVWNMFVIGLDRVERIYHFRSVDGENWEPFSQQPVMENTGWHNFYTRPASVLPMAVGYLFVYEGSNLRWYDPNYNIATGLAYSPDLTAFYDLTPEEPLFTSTTPGDFHTWRYSHWMQVGNKVYVYFEAARPNKSNELRLAVLEAPGALGNFKPCDPAK